MQRALQLAETGFGPESNPVVEIRVELADIQLRRNENDAAAQQSAGQSGQRADQISARLADRCVCSTGSVRAFGIYRSQPCSTQGLRFRTIAFFERQRASSAVVADESTAPSIRRYAWTSSNCEALNRDRK